MKLGEICCLRLTMAGHNPYEARIINISSHSKHSGEEVAELMEDDKRVLRYLVQQINEMYRFNPNAT